MYFHYMKSTKFIKIFVVPTSDACIENQLFGASGMFYHSGSQLVFLIYKIFFSATKVYIDDVLTCRAWKRDSVAKKK